MTTILVIDDDESLRDTIGIMLEQEGFSPILVADGKAGFERALSVKPDLMIVDLRLPGMSGTEICKQVRAANLKTPMIVLSAVGEEVDKVLLLEIGADDYIVKPFGARELLARIRALLRRTSAEARKVAQFGAIAVDFERRVVSRRGEPLKMTPAEYNLLTYFLHNPDRPLTRDMILNSVWGYESFPNTRTVDAHVVRLRQKLEADANSPRHFLTVHGVGYRFSAVTHASGAVLIVEDAETCASTLEIIFSSIRGLRVLTAATAEQAWDLIESRDQDIRAIVTDLHMPGMDGFELIDRVRADVTHAGLPIVVITGSTDPYLSDHLRHRGVSAIFAKPYSPAVVREKLEQLLKNEIQLEKN